MSRRSRNIKGERQEPYDVNSLGEPVLTVGADIDAAALAQEIQQEVARKKASGDYPPDLMAALEAASDPLTSALDDLRKGADLTLDPPLDSGRRILGKPTVAVKSALRLGMRWHTHWLVRQVATFASTVVRMATVIAGRLDHQETAIRQIRADTAKARAQSKINRLELARIVHQLDNSASDVIDWPKLDAQLRTPAASAARHSEHVDLLRGVAGPVVHLGCGRGDLLADLNAADIDCYGIDTRETMIAICRERGLDARKDDVLSHLAAIAPQTLGGVLATRVVEQLSAAGVVSLFNLAARAVTDGGVVVVEALNPQSMAALTGTLFADPELVRPIHPNTLAFIAESAGLRQVQLRYASQVEDRLAMLSSAGNPVLDQIVNALNENFRKIDRVLHGSTYVTVVSRR